MTENRRCGVQTLGIFSRSQITTDLLVFKRFRFFFFLSHLFFWRFFFNALFVFAKQLKDYIARQNRRALCSILFRKGVTLLNEKQQYE